jgi:hypothetical protein
MKVSSQIHGSAALLPWKQPPVPTGQEAGWTPEPVWSLWSRAEPLAHIENRTSAFELAASRYADTVTSAPYNIFISSYFSNKGHDTV